MEKIESLSMATREGALWCMVGRAGVLAKKAPSAALDRAALALARFDCSDISTLRDNAEAIARAAGLDPTRLPLIDLGEALCLAGPHAVAVRIFAMEAAEAPLSEGFAVAPLEPTADGPMADALVWAGAHLYFASPRSKGRPRDYEVLASLGAHLVPEERFNEWFSDASRLFGELGLSLDFDVADLDRPTIRLSGRAAVLPSEIAAARERLLDLGRHARGRFWVTEIISGEERVRDYADPSAHAAILAEFAGGASLVTA
jgi:hypothetical protein